MKFTAIVFLRLSSQKNKQTKQKKQKNKTKQQQKKKKKKKRTSSVRAVSRQQYLLLETRLRIA